MFSFRTTSLLEQPDNVLRNGRLGILCNQVAWQPDKGEYLFETLYKRGRLKRVFTPEHGLFGELQDQVTLDDTEVYGKLGLEGCEFVSLYGTDENSLSASAAKLEDLDALIIELQDVGSRYYTFTTTVFNLFKVLKKHDLNLSIYIVDRMNPAGRQVEGTMLEKGYGSFIGIEGIPHRHGLTFGELTNLFYNEINAKFPLHIIAYTAEKVSKDLLPWSIPPSPNIPGLFTCHFYSGQVLWEGTNVSEGRGTTRPFEVFGAPFMSNLLEYNKKHGFSNWNDSDNPISDPAVYIRWQKFIPTFHKYKGEVCTGFQLHPVPGEQYHALAHNLKIIRFVAENCPGFNFPDGVYERGNDKSAIELLLGDKLLIDYVKGSSDWETVKEHIKVEEQKWIRKAKKFMLYEEQLYRCK
ncbi:hypothetical protein BRDCF_p1220 [Bacteroidales bacterium CF]|jgi:Uncharacterized protein conserved in bacteria|nr:hypothetical protein BRDCF_p1220 [Bacteroidales bacterium CF]NCB98739.1 DUF1343 domain-containing protein [Bacteroidia bacterium]